MNDHFINIMIRKAEQLQHTGQLAEARALLEEAVALDPVNPEVQANLGKVCGYLKDHPTAIAHLEIALQSTEEDLELLFSLGYEYCQTGRYAEAVGCFDRTLRFAPQFPALHRWRGYALAEIGRGEEAWSAYQEALLLKPDYDEVFAGLANLLFNNKEIEEAEKYLQKAVALSPDKAAYHNDLGRVYRQQGRMEDAVSCFRKALELEPENLAAASNVLYGMCYLDNVAPECLAEEHQQFARRFYPPSQLPPRRKPARAAGKPLHVGYVSSDFGTHSVSFFLEPILIHHDRERFKIFCYSNRGVPDETTHRIRGMDVVWRDIMGVPAATAAAQIAEDGIDILVDLSGHTAGHRLDILAQKPAPVQANWIGYPHSTGLSQIDYYLSDDLCDPPGMTDHLFSEQVWRLPRIFSCYLPPLEFPAVTLPPFQVNNGITFGSFNNFAKVSGTTIKIWSTLLRNIPDSKLVLKSASLGGATLKQSVYDRFAEGGVTPDRIILMPFAPSTHEHLAQYSRVDIALDTFPYHGTTTTCEALWMGVPVVTLAGASHLSRVGVSFLNAVSLKELVATTPEDYISIATRLAFNKQRLIHLRENLRSMMALSPLMDAKGVTQEIEGAFQQMILKRGNDGKP